MIEKIYLEEGARDGQPGDKFLHYYLNPVYILKVEIEGVSSGNRALVAIRLVIINNLLLLYLPHCKYFSLKRRVFICPIVKHNF